MKQKILPFIIGLLIGAIIATGGFLIYENVKSGDKSTVNGMEDMRQMGPKNGNFDGQAPKELPEGENATDTNSKKTKQNKKNTESSQNSNTIQEKPADDAKTTDESNV